MRALNYDTIEEAEKVAVKAQAAHTLAKTPRARPASGYYGVSADGKRWTAKIY
jgi:hypothetical protein